MRLKIIAPTMQAASCSGFKQAARFNKSPSLRLSVYEVVAFEKHQSQLTTKAK